jgi:hypothetical protein
MLKSLHVKSIKLMTNNPAKIEDLQLHGVKITGRIPVIVPPNKYDRFYLETKKRAGHLLDKKEPEEFMEQAEPGPDNHHWEQSE